MARSLLSKASGAPVAKQSVHQEEFAKHLCHETLVSGVLPADMLSKRLVVEDLLSNATRLDAPPALAVIPDPPRAHHIKSMGRFGERLTCLVSP